MTTLTSPASSRWVPARIFYAARKSTIVLNRRETFVNEPGDLTGKFLPGMTLSIFEKESSQNTRSNPLSLCRVRAYDQLILEAPERRIVDF